MTYLCLAAATCAEKQCACCDGDWNGASALETVAMDFVKDCNGSAPGTWPEPRPVLGWGWHCPRSLFSTTPPSLRHSRQAPENSGSRGES